MPAKTTPVLKFSPSFHSLQILEDKLFFFFPFLFSFPKAFLLEVAPSSVAEATANPSHNEHTIADRVRPEKETEERAAYVRIITQEETEQRKRGIFEVVERGKTQTEFASINGKNKYI